MADFCESRVGREQEVGSCGESSGPRAPPPTLAHGPPQLAARHLADGRLWKSTLTLGSEIQTSLPSPTSQLTPALGQGLPLLCSNCCNTETRGRIAGYLDRYV